MRVASWNINGVRARLDYLLRWLDDRRPDLLGLQELKVADEGFPSNAFAELGYYSAAYGEKAWNGVAVLAREPIEVLQRGLPGQELAGARLLSTRVGELTFTSVYCPNGKSLDHPDFELKLAWLDALTEYWQARVEPGMPAILCGDFNVVPGDLDSWHPEGFEEGIFHTPAERRRLEALLDGGLVDLFRARNPELRAYSWWDYRGGAFPRNQGLRIDLLLATQPVLDRVGEVTIDRDYRKKKDGLTPSDHAPVWADLDIRG